MKLIFAGAIGGWELILIFAVILLLFGARKLPELARGLGQAVKEFRKASRELEHEITSAADDTGSPTQTHTKPGQGLDNSKSTRSAESSNAKS